MPIALTNLISVIFNIPYQSISFISSLTPTIPMQWNILNKIFIYFMHSNSYCFPDSAWNESVFSVRQILPHLK